VRDFRSYAEVAEEMSRASMVFLLPHQLELMPDRRYGLSLNISSFGEMQQEQIAAYFRTLERVTAGHFYMKQWKVSQNAFDNLSLTEATIPLAAAGGKSIPGSARFRRRSSRRFTRPSEAMANYCAVYDFDLMPYALGDVLTWNVQTAIRCEEAGRDAVDVHICLDQRYPSSIYQSDMIRPTTAGCSSMSCSARSAPTRGSATSSSTAAATTRCRGSGGGGRRPCERRGAVPTMSMRWPSATTKTNGAYFTKYIHYHKGINAFAAKHGRIPCCRPAWAASRTLPACSARHLSGKRVVLVHVRQRPPGSGYGGAHTLCAGLRISWSGTTSCAKPSGAIRTCSSWCSGACRKSRWNCCVCRM
jgi:hypothetical protein